MQLPVFQTTGEILEYCWDRRQAMLTYAVMPIVFVVVLNLGAWGLGLDVTNFQSPAVIALNILNGIVFLPFTVTWYRMVIMGHEGLVGRGSFTFTTLEGRLFGWQLIIGLIVVAIGASGGILIGGLAGALSAAGSGAAPAISAVLMGIWIVVIVAIACRLSLVLAMVATDRPAALGEAWAQTKGLGGRMAAIFILCLLSAVVLLIPLQFIVVVAAAIVGLLSDGLGESAAIVLGVIAGAFGSLMILVFPTTLFALVYNKIAQAMAAGHSAYREAAESDHDQTASAPDRLPQQAHADEVETAISRLAAFLKDKPRDTAADMRRMIDDFFATFPMPEDVTIEDTDANGVAVRWVAAGGADPDRVVLLFHGGGFTAGSLTSHQRLAADLSAACGARVLIASYRLGPEHPYPAGLDDCVSVYHWLLEEGYKPGRIALAGDSAGGGLAISTAMRLKDEGLDQPAALIALSPWVNLACDGETMDSKAKDDPVTNRDNLLRAANDYLDGQFNKDPLVSPIYGDLRGLPPILIQVGSREVLLDDSRKLAVRARADDVDVTLEEWPGMFHVWHMMADWLSDGRRALGGIGAFVNRHMG